jgi:hypothetical protein
VVTVSAAPLRREANLLAWPAGPVAVNQVCRRLEGQGLPRRVVGPAGKIVNEPVDGPSPPAAPAPASGTATTASTLMTEDEVKRAVAAYLTARGLDVEVWWSRNRGVDILVTGRGTMRHRGEGCGRQRPAAKQLLPPHKPPESSFRAVSMNHGA